MYHTPLSNNMQDFHKYVLIGSLVLRKRGWELKFDLRIGTVSASDD